ncbi:hypothetical protein ACFLQ5_01295 [Bacteroidota bacterium]
MKKIYLFIVVILLLLMQIPFLKADPDKLVDVCTRGAWTDEGLYTSQIRNFVNGYEFDIEGNNTFVRGPVFNIIQLPFFYIFGAKLIVSRLIVLLSSILVLLLFIKSKNYVFAFFLSITTLTQFHIFQFAHYGLAEMMSISFIILSLYFFLKFYESHCSKIKWLFFASLMIFLCYSIKIQYLYTILIVPISVLLIFMQNKIIAKSTDKTRIKSIVLSFGFAMGFGLIYFIAWYLPNSEFYNYIMIIETGQRFPTELSQLPGAIKFSVLNYFWVKELKLLLVFFLVAIITLFVINRFPKKNYFSNPLGIFIIVWIITELHKLPLLYLPNRYLISTFFALGAFISFAFSTIQNKKNKSYLIAFAIIIGLINTSFNINAYNRRTFKIIKINEYLSHYNFDGKTILGNWAPSLCWNTNAKILPVCNDFLNYNKPIENYKPTIIISEVDEKDNDKAYFSQNINLDEISDSSKYFRLWKFDLKLYWIKQ